MKSSGYQNKLKLAILFLLVLSLTTIGTIAYHLLQSKKTEQLQQSDNMQGKQSYNGRYFRDRLGLSAVQMEKFKEINFQFRQQARLINQGLAQHRLSMLNAMQEPIADTLILTELSGKIGELHKTLKIETYKYYLGIKGICDSTQQNELNLIFNEFFINENEMVGSGNGKQMKGYRKGKNK